MVLTLSFPTVAKHKEINTANLCHALLSMRELVEVHNGHQYLENKLLINNQYFTYLQIKLINDTNLVQLIDEIVARSMGL